MSETGPTYEAKAIPKTLGEVLRALCAPFLEEQCGWRVLSWSGPGDNWVWVRYPYGDYMKLRLAQSASGGYSISYEDTPLEDRLSSKVTLVIYDPERPTEHKMTLVGMGEKKPEAKKKEKVTDADVIKAAHTYALKDALEQAGMGVGVGKRLYTLPYTSPDGEKTDKYGIPLAEYENGTMAGKNHKQANGASQSPAVGEKKKANSKPAESKTPQPQSNSALINITAVRAWLASRVENIDATHLGKDSYAKHQGALTVALKQMGLTFNEVMAAAWGEGEYTIEQIITLQQLEHRTDGKEAIQHLLDG